MNSITAKEQIARHLMRPDVKDEFEPTVIFIVFKTIEANSNITLNQLRWTLNKELLLKDDVIDGAVASLTSTSLFGCVNRFQPPSKKLKPKPDNCANPIHLRARPEQSCEFQQWLNELLVKMPELSVFTPPHFVRHTQCASNAPQARRCKQ